MTDPAVPPVAPTPAYAAAPAVVPGKTLGIVGLILAIFFPLVGLIISIVARSQSKAAGVPNTPATAGIIVGIALIVVGIIAAIALSLAGLAIGSYGN